MRDAALLWQNTEYAHQDAGHPLIPSKAEPRQSCGLCAALAFSATYTLKF